MAIGPLELQATIPRVQDFAIQRQGEETKIATDQAHVVQHMKDETDNKHNAVTRADDPSNNLKKFDARDKGSNEYSGDGGRHRKQEEEKEKEGSVVVKGYPGSFDIRI